MIKKADCLSAGRNKSALTLSVRVRDDASDIVGNVYDVKLDLIENRPAIQGLMLFTNQNKGTKAHELHLSIPDKVFGVRVENGAIVCFAHPDRVGVTERSTDPNEEVALSTTPLNEAMRPEARDGNGFLVETSEEVAARQELEKGDPSTHLGYGVKPQDFPPRATRSVDYVLPLKPLQALCAARIVLEAERRGRPITLDEVAQAARHTNAQRISGFALFLCRINVLAKTEGCFVMAGKADELIRDNIDDTKVGRTIAKIWGNASHD